MAGSAGPNVLDGGDGDDTIDGREGNDLLQGGATGSGSDHLLGGDGADDLRGGPGDDLAEGGPGDDTVLGQGGTDTLVGDAGKDELSGGPGIDSLHGGDDDDTLNGSETNPVGADGDDKLYGDAGDDVLLGGPADDRLDGGAGADDMHGNDGRDAVSYEGRGARIEVTFDGRANDGEPGEHDNVADDMEDVLGGNRDDSLTGDARANALDGGLGNDFVNGAAGSDALLGGGGVDILRARDGLRDQDVSCGPGVDLAIADRSDPTRGCEFVVRRRGSRPGFGNSAIVEPVRGTVGLRLPGTRPFVRAPGPIDVPLRSTIDPGKGTVWVSTARRRGGRVQRASLRGGRFSVVQPGGRAVTQLRLAGFNFGKCRSPKADRKKVRRQLRARIQKQRRGEQEVVGRYSRAGSEGTTWVTEDRCDGTLTRVIEGTVWVHDFTGKRTVRVRADHTYLAPAG
jgi:hypothetical protein